MFVLVSMEWSMLFSKGSRSLKLQFFWRRCFLFNTEDNYNTTQRRFAVKDLDIYGFLNFLHEGLLLGGVDDSKPLDSWVNKGCIPSTYYAFPLIESQNCI